MLNHGSPSPTILRSLSTSCSPILQLGRAGGSCSPEARRRARPPCTRPRSATTGVTASVWWSDERCVPPDDDLSNYALAKRTLLDRLTHQPDVHRIRGELDPADASGEYDKKLEGRSPRPAPSRPRPRRTRRVALPALAAARRAGPPCDKDRPGSSPSSTASRMTLPLLSAQRIVFPRLRRRARPAVERAFLGWRSHQGAWPALLRDG